MPVINHVHTYVKYKGRPGFFRCDAPDCTHFIDKESIIGKYSLCTECGSQMILSKDDLRRSRPKCLNCANTKKAKEWRKVQELTKYLGTESFNPLGLNLKSTIEEIKSDEEGHSSTTSLEEEELEEEEEEEKNE